MSVNEVLEAVRGMSPQERARVRDLLETLPTADISPEESVQHRLSDAGLLSDVRPRQRARRERGSPVEIKGAPLSATVIEDRG